ncbi:putative manganese transporter [Rhodovibrionaceae bacterium A322]
MSQALSLPQTWYRHSRAYVLGEGREGLAAVLSTKKLLLLALAVLLTIFPATRTLLFQMIGDAYLQVSVFVAATLAIAYLLEKRFAIDTGEFLSRHRKWQVPAASFLGALPGCGGAVMVVTQYVRGSLTFGSVVATLTATMGDAAFLLLAREPQTGLAMWGLGLTVGMISGWAVDLFHAPGYMKGMGTTLQESDGPEAKGPVIGFLEKLWLVCLLPGMVLGIMLAFQVDIDAYFATSWFADPASWFGFLCGALGLTLWMARPNSYGVVPDCNQPVGARVSAETNFITTWVVVGFLAYEVAVVVFNLEPAALFQSYGWVLPLLGVGIGFLPGCGPQVLVTTLYLNGLVPLSAQIGNAISNDGDALFPALALAPKAAILATAYSSIPALIMAYSWFFLFE